MGSMLAQRFLARLMRQRSLRLGAEGAAAAAEVQQSGLSQEALVERNPVFVFVPQRASRPVVWHC
jgi:hypothetical protein